MSTDGSPGRASNRIARQRPFRCGFCTTQMPAPHRHTIECLDGLMVRLWLRPERKCQRLPQVAALGREAERRGRLIAAVHHAILAARILRLSVAIPELVP